jgi:hypothetical protein
MLSNRVAFLCLVFLPIFTYIAGKNEWMDNLFPRFSLVALVFFWFYCYVSLVLSMGMRFGLLNPNNPQHIRVARGFYLILTKEGRAKVHDFCGDHF